MDHKHAIATPGRSLMARSISEGAFRRPVNPTPERSPPPPSSGRRPCRPLNCRVGRSGSAPFVFTRPFCVGRTLPRLWRHCLALLSKSKSKSSSSLIHPAFRRSFLGSGTLDSTRGLKRGRFNDEWCVSPPVFETRSYGECGRAAKTYGIEERNEGRE